MRKWLGVIGLCGLLLGCASSGSRQTLTAVGYAPIATQSGKTLQERQIQAMRASRLDAYRDMAEQVYGLRINTDSQVAADGALRDAGIRSQAAGVIRGAEVVRSYPVGDNYVTELRLDMSQVKQLPPLSAPAKPAAPAPQPVILVPARGATY